jgi:hypothetical protein
MSYESFKQEAAGRGLTDLTQEEYDNIVQAHPGASTPALCRFVKAARKGVVGSGERSQNKAFALGAKDHMYSGMSIDKASSQKITFLFDDGRMADFMWKGDWDGIHGRRHEVEVEEGERQKRDSDGTYEYRDLKVSKVLEERVDISQIPLTDMSKLNEEDLYSSVAFHGTVRGVWAETLWEKGESVGEHDYRQGAYPTCALSFKEDDVFINAHFGPYKRAIPLVKMEDWDINVAKTIDDLTGYMYEAEVIIVGHVNSIKEKKDKETGEEVTYIHMAATAIFDADEIEVAAPVVTKSAPTKQVKVVTDPAKEKTRSKDMVAAMMKGIKVIGPDCTLDELRGKYIGDEEDDKIANMAFKIAMKKYQESNTPAPAEEEEDGSEDEDEPEDEPDDEEAGEEVEEEEVEEDDDPTPDDLLEADILDFIEEMEHVEISDIKKKFRKKKIGDRATKVGHITDALKVLEDEEEIVNVDGLVSLAN